VKRLTERLLCVCVRVQEAAGAGKRKAGSDDTDKGKKKGRPAAEELVGTVLAGQVSAVKATHLDVTLSNRCVVTQLTCMLTLPRFMLT
jgi:hypothetical protein